MDKSKWEYKKLGEVCKVINGLWTGKKPPFVNVGVIRNANFTKTCELDASNIAYIDVEKKQFDQRKLIKGDIIIEKSGGSDKQPVGRPVLFNLDGDFSFSNFTSALRIEDHHDIYSNYLYKYLKYVYFSGATKAMQSNTTGLHNLDFSKFKALLIPIAPLSDQQRIVAELDCLNEMIAVKQEQLKEFDKRAQSIFYDMFESIDKSVPASHYIESLGGGKSLAGEIECTNKVLKTGAVTYDYFKEDEVKNLPVDYQPLEEHLLKDGDLLVSRMNTLEYVGAIAYVWKAPQNTYLPDRLWRAKLKSGANPIYLWYSLKQDKAKEQIRSKASGTSGSMKNISMPKFLSTTIKDVPLALQQQFAEKIQAIEAQKELVKQSIAETQSLLDYTMDKYFGYD